MTNRELAELWSRAICEAALEEKSEVVVFGRMVETQSAECIAALETELASARNLYAAQEERYERGQKSEDAARDRIAALEAQVAEARKLARRLCRMIPRIYERLDSATVSKMGQSLYAEFWECGKELNRHFAAIDKEIEAMDFSYIGEEATAEQVKAKVLPGAVEYTRQELARKAAE